MDLRIRTATSDDGAALAALIHASTNGWYQSQGRPPVFTCAPEDCALYPQVYEHLDPGQCLLAEDAATGTLLGSCFVHPRPTHLSLGIMNVAPAAFGRGVARRLLDRICAQADAAGLPLRLVSSALNLDSFSLYNARGFVPTGVFQDVLLDVPAGGLRDAGPLGGVPLAGEPLAGVRPATPDDVPALAALERELHGIERADDLRFFCADPLGCFRLFVAAGDRAGTPPRGWLASVRHPATAMLGPGVARDDATAFALTTYALDAHHRGGSCVWLVASDRPQLVQRVRALGARNIELHLTQCRGPWQRPAGVVFPTFLPESG